MFEIVNGRRTDDGRTPEHGYTISSPCEPNGSGELIILVNMSNRRMSLFYIQNAIQCRACTDIPTITRRRKLGIDWFRVVHVKSRIFPLQFEEVGQMLVSGCSCTQ